MTTVQISIAKAAWKAATEQVISIGRGASAAAYGPGLAGRLFRERQKKKRATGAAERWISTEKQLLEKWIDANTGKRSLEIGRHPLSRDKDPAEFWRPIDGKEYAAHSRPI